ncbi:MAG TPA: NAD(P)/FAD-dependent oxidoreductase [Chloroflexota bacterium]|nr:NAD(P)/FAD-dependent oxidoreductase [Chloroflexota bacterium]
MNVADFPALPDDDGQPSNRILILGAGYGGLRCAQALSKYLDDPGAPEVVLIDRNSYHQIITQLPEAVSGRLSADDVAVPFSELLKHSRVRFIQAGARELDLANQCVVTNRGILSYGTLVIALGSVTAYYGVPGLAEYALTLKSVEDAEEVNRAVTTAIEQASRESDPRARSRLLSILIGGAGLTGVELAGELAEVLPTIAQEHGVNPSEPRVTLIEATPTVLPSMPARLQSKAAAILSELGIRLVLGGKVVRADAEGIDLASGDRLVGGTLIWTGGIMAPPLLSEAGLPTVPNGHVLVGEYLQPAGYPNLYVVGDSARLAELEDDQVLPPTAQVALKQAEAAAYNIVAGWEGWQRKPYIPSNKGQVVSLGAESGVASVFHIPLVGKKVLALKAIIAESYRFSVTGQLGSRR